VQGFNDGYLLEKHEPKLNKSLVKGLEAADDGKEPLPFVEGMLHGRKQFQREAFLDQANEAVNQQKSLDQTREDNDLSR
jgi:hypothetical protein